MKLLAETEEITKVGIGGRNTERISILLRSLEERKDKCEAVILDLDDRASIGKALNGYDAVVNASKVMYNRPLVEEAFEARKHYLDLAGYSAELAAEAVRFKDINKTAFFCMGNCPGTSNILVKKGLSLIDDPREAHIRVGTKRLEPFYGFHMAPSVLINEFIAEPLVYEQGSYRSLPPMSGLGDLEFPEPVGKVQGFYAYHSELISLPRTCPQLKDITYKVSFPEEVMTMMRVLMYLHMASKEEVEVKGAHISPIDFLEKVAGGFDASERYIREVKALQVDVSGLKDGEPRAYRFNVTSGSNDRLKIIASAYWACVPAVLVLKMLAQGIVKTPGAFAPEEIIEADLLLPGLVDYGITLEEIRLF